MLCPRCRAEMEPPVYEYGPIRLDVGRHIVTVNGGQIHLAPQQFRLLLLLIERPEEVVSQHDLWYGVSQEAEPQIVHVITARLRRSLGRAGRMIRSVPRFGLMLSAIDPENDLTDSRFAHLVVIRRSARKCSTGLIWWVCRCDCGRTTLVRSDKLRGGDVKSCGCLADENRRTWGRRRSCAAQAYLHSVAP